MHSKINVIKASLRNALRIKRGSNWGCYYFLFEENNPVNK
jgi:hypothetical protein